MDGFPQFVGVIDLEFNSITKVGTDQFDVLGVFDFDCSTLVSPCEGKELFKGTIDGNDIALEGIEIQDNIGPVFALSLYKATFSNDGSSIMGSYFGPSDNTMGTWSVVAVPEPSTFALLALGLLGLGLARRKNA